MQIDGLAALVTGAASGLGEATARALAANGAKVALLDRDADKLNAVAKDIDGLAIACDVTSAEEVAAAFATARERHGLCAIAVSCAGVAPAAKIVGRDGPMDLDVFRKVIDINLIGTFNILRLAAADMAQREPNEDGERGIIINTASIAAYEGQIGQAAYAASKAGVVGLTLPAAREFARSGIRVNAIAPGLFGTPMLLGMPQEVQDSLTATLPFPRRFGKPQEYASLVLHMVENTVMNGECVRLDSALRMQPR
ncbi:SDR family NAD(P)-dependent oxidoreductase [Hwanghaeella sp. LZ110]|uniref:SDR family NAD(P)-dependent oxidoreductase n=1 Tax=Hwanghaeella sp. LZ110 TaxID=3402810 RepID=UPI003B67D3A6